MTFLYPYWLLLLIPFGQLLFWQVSSQTPSGLIAPPLASSLGLVNKRYAKRSHSLLALSWLIAIIALAGPSIEKQSIPTYQATGARMLILDMSQSVYAKDIKPDRLTQIKYKALDLLPHWSEGETGLIAYAGDAYTLSPLTTDSATLSNLIHNISPDIMPYQGARADKAVALAIATLEKNGHHRGDIVLISDDIDSQEQQAITQQLRGKDWTLSVLAVGTENGAPIPGKDNSLLKNAAGVPVVAKTTFANMDALAKTSGGVFAPVQNDNSDIELIARLTDHHSADESVKNKQKTEQQINNGFWLLPILLLPALTLFRKGMLLVLLIPGLSLLTPSQSEASPWHTADQQAYQAYQNKDYQKAATQFHNQKWQAAANYEAEQYAKAIDLYKGLDDMDSKYNLANAYAKMANWKKPNRLIKRCLKPIRITAMPKPI